MKLENFTLDLNARFGKFIRMSTLPALLLLFSMQVDAQSCPLGCNNSVQISLDVDCLVEVTPDMVLEGQGTQGCNYTVAVLGANDQPIPGSPFVDGSYIGETLKVRVSLGANSCWGYITIEDKLAPIIDCPGDMTVSCYESGDFPLPPATDNCDNFVPVEVVSDVTDDLDCTAMYSAVRTIIYRATDESGNVSDLCTKQIFYMRIGLADIVFPPNYDDVEEDVLECDNIPFWDINGNFYPDVEETGVPETLDGFPIFPNNSLCELNAAYSDQVLEICESSFKVLRSWIILDWCTGEIAEEFQIIKVIDREDPIVTCTPDDPYAVSADPYNCTADWNVPAPNVIYDCSSTTYTVAYLLADNNGNPPVNGLYTTENVFELPNGSYVIRDLPLGRTWVRYTITDACGNSTECFTEIDVVDDVPPIPVCDEFTVVTLTTDGSAYIFAESFDDGSHDNCTDVSFDVRRMTPGCGGSTTVYSEYAQFCCADVGNEVMVELRVKDEFDNYNTCMVVVTVQDKLDPVIDCPPDVTLDCGDDIDDVNLTGYAEASDNCGVQSLTHVDQGSLNQCGVGTIFRVFTVTDFGGRTASCVQRIDFIDQTPFTGNISWPSDRNLSGCMNVDTDPDNTGRPGYNDDECSLIADTYEDQVFNFVDGACFKILRTWTVIDWCTFNQNNPTAGGLYQYTQIIKVNNFVDPVFDSCNNLTACIYGEDCDGFVEITINATDDCTPAEDLEYTYALDIGNDGSVNYVGSSNDASRILEPGTHSIRWTVEDQCGNQVACEHLIFVNDCKNPTPYCLSEITTVVMPSSGEITIWANDFDLGSYDNCPGDLRFSFSSNTNNTSATFTCDDLGMNNLEIWVTDASGNQDFCDTKINIQANNDACDNSRIGGDVVTDTQSGLMDVMVQLENMTSTDQGVMESMTPESGHYQFQGMLTNDDYKITASKDEDYMNGVSTLDLVLIQRHILQLETFDSPYKVIASDINDSGTISASDLIALRKLILGVYSDLPNNQSWRFVDATQTFADESKPFPFTEEIMVESFLDNDMDNNFVAVKIGDVNGTAALNLNQEESDIRSASVLELSTNDQSYTNGDIVNVEITSDNFEEMLGYQFTIDMDASLSFVDVEAGAMNVSTDNLGLALAERGKISMSWNQVQPVSFSSEEVLFTLVFRAESNGSVKTGVTLTSDITSAESYTKEFEVADIALNVRDAVSEEISSFELLQNRPNPFNENTTISFVLSEEANTVLTVYDITGKIVHTQSGTYGKGMNSIELSSQQIATPGVLYYQLEANGSVATKKMINLSK